MEYKRILTIQDISCVGQCSLTVALPILSACGMETCILPSAVLSTHTGGFTGYTFRDLSSDMPAIREHWQKENIKFDCFYTGYLGSLEQMEYIKDIFKGTSKDNSLVVIDPAMADNGKLYPGFDTAYVDGMKEFCKSADIVLPNITEACQITGMEYKESYDEAYIKELLSTLSKTCNCTVVLTGVSYKKDTTGIAILENGEYSYYEHKKLPQSSHGTGDVYASAFVGALMRGHDVYEAAGIAAEYTVLCIQLTAGDESHKYGVKFELAIPELIDML